MIKRKYILGDEWLYYKVYCGSRTADTILEDLIAPLVQQLLEEKLISHWFFIRYNDPDSHLRLRFKLVNIDYIGEVIKKCKKSFSVFIDESLIWKVQVDTYVRELERYGNSTMEFSEQIFFYDSQLVIKGMSLMKDEKSYFLFILKSIDSFLNQFELKETEKLNFYIENAKTFKEEFKVQKTTKISLDRKYRDLRSNFENIMDGNYSNIYIQAIHFLGEREDNISAIVDKMLELEKAKKIEITIRNLLNSYIHMFLNKAFRNKQRFHEMIVYDFLSRYQLSRAKKQ